ncbi:hypothetical protein [Helicobacter rodentium]|uniref:hypothetical protein n=1 Tax=Helicobacter rodentium TaxID=59617 RepID=UPI0023576DCF|nr:hypothetical protein [Helicobacter rodentium]
MKNLICIVFAFLVLIFGGCESRILITENQIQPASEYNIVKFGNLNYFSIQSIYQNHFKRVFIFH